MSKQGTKRRFTITQADIDLGIPRSSWACAIVQTMQREFPGVEPSVVPIQTSDAVIVGHEVRLYEYDGNIQPQPRLVGQYRLSGNASKWIHKFDTGRDVTPATFEMTSIREERIT